MNLKNDYANEKVTAGAAAGFISAFAIGTFAMVAPDLAAKIPPGYESALTGFLIVLTAWWKREHGNYGP